MRLNPFRKKALSATESALDLFSLYGGGYFAFPRSAYVDGRVIEAQQASYGAIYDLQVNVRTVIDYIARTVSQPGLHLYRYLPNGDREEDGHHPAAVTMRRPNEWQGQRELLEGFVKDFLIYENAYLWKAGVMENNRLLLIRVPPNAIGSRRGQSEYVPGSYRIMLSDGEFLDVPRSGLIHWRGYSPLGSPLGSSRMENLRQDLVEEAARKAQTLEFVKGGMVKGGIIERPLEAPDLSDAALTRLQEDFEARLKGVHRGRTPILEEGMKFVDSMVTPKEAEVLRARELSLATVCRAYGLSPIIFDIQTGGGSSGGIREARSAAEEDLFGPMGRRLAEALNVQLLGDTYDDQDDFYFEFSARQELDLQKLYEAGSRAAGGPFLTINEWRRDLNLPPVAGGDELVTPLNVVRGGGSQPAPATVGDSPDRGRPEEASDLDLEVKAWTRRQARFERRDRHAAEHESLLKRHFRRQRRTLEEAQKAEALDARRWDEELGRDLYRLGRKTVVEEGDITASRMAGSFDPEQVGNYLREGSAAAAGAINAQTALDVRRAAGEGKPASEVFDVAVAVRAGRLATSRATQLVSFATFEAGKQNERPGEVRLKEWVWSGKPNSRHASLAGATVPLANTFPNGARYPGDPALGPEDNVNCGCALEVL